MGKANSQCKATAGYEALHEPSCHFGLVRDKLAKIPSMSLLHYQFSKN